jgi:aldose 1-epimerase
VSGPGRSVGEIVAIGDGRIAIEVLPDVGARLHRLRFDGRDLLRTPADPVAHLDDPWFWGSYPMAPWCNRLPPIRTDVAGRVLDLPANFRDGTAIHGQVDRAPWQRTADGSFRIEGGGDGWPWRYAVEQELAIDAARLDLALRLTNLDDAAMPAGVGIHPWFAKPLAVAIRAAAVHPDNLATEAAPVPVAGALDRRALAPMPDDLDATWVDLDEPPIALAWPGPGIACTITFDAPTRVVTAASPAILDAVAVEPATHAPAGIRRLLGSEPGGMSLLGAGETMELRIRFAFEAQS